MSSRFRLVAIVDGSPIRFSSPDFQDFCQAQTHVAEAVRTFAPRGCLSAILLQRSVTARGADGATAAWITEKRWDETVVRRICAQSGIRCPQAALSGARLHESAPRGASDETDTLVRLRTAAPSSESTTARASGPAQDSAPPSLCGTLGDPPAVCSPPALCAHAERVEPALATEPAELTAPDRLPAANAPAEVCASQPATAADAPAEQTSPKQMNAANSPVEPPDVMTVESLGPSDSGPQCGPILRPAHRSTRYALLSSAAFVLLATGTLYFVQTDGKLFAGVHEAGSRLVTELPFEADAFAKARPPADVPQHVRLSEPLPAERDVQQR